jgi:hypothetical protein
MDLLSAGDGGSRSWHSLLWHKRERRTQRLVVRQSAGIRNHDLGDDVQTIQLWRAYRQSGRRTRHTV